ncbi:condensation domain-containing protein [Streptomyces sp. DK15]|uniref:condensation domain-containing protein n=1 Tax=Streptomyces sp. DK15 TaxID=2957499 RepID=UPI0029BFD39E|nr:condensation domain-containing protein [Streptomyces sp. DK15]
MKGCGALSSRHPVSWTQRHRLGQIRSESDAGVYRSHHPSVALRIRGDLQTVALERAWIRLQERHPVLRCGFDLSHFTWRLDAPAAAAGIILADSEPDETAGSAVGRMERLVDAPFDFEQGPLARLILLRRQEEDLFALVLDHLVGDFWSLDLLMSDLTTLYADELGLPTDPLPPVSLPYPDQVRQQNAYLDSAAGLRALDVLSESLKTVGPVPETRFEGFSGEIHAGYDRTGLVRATFGSGLTSAVFASARSYRMTPWTLIHAALHRALYALSDQQSIGTTLMTANRESTSVHQTVGFLASKVVVATWRDDQAGTAEFLRGFQRSVMNALDFTAIPWPRLIAHMEPSALGCHAKVPYISFNPQNSTMRRWLGGWRFTGCEAAPLDLAGSTPDAAVVISLTEVEADIEVSLYHRTDWYPAEAVEKLWKATEQTLREWVGEAGFADEAP